ncbi:MAG TPA: tyrosine-type recombinase/integrase, partial [Urbifossiella sp.]|nr:tyrosine-type recombinase/integrase [Urbifossiella sp.]
RGSLRTRHHYRTSIRAFGVWLEASGRTPRNPFASLEKVRNIETDRRLVRRALSQEEFDRLIATTENSLRRFCKLRGRQRAMLYRLVAGTGLRRGEASSLHPSSFRLEAEVPHVGVAAAYTKNRKQAVQPIPPSLVPLLRGYLAGLPERPVWPVSKGMTSLMVAGDLEEAGIPVVSADGRSYDFHSIRGQFATRLALAGVGLAAAQKLLRHSTPTLTSNIYTHLGLRDLGDAVAGL